MVIVDDSRDFLAAATMLLESEGASVVGIARTPQEAVRRVAELRPDATLIDVHLGAASGFEVARTLWEQAVTEPERVILISTGSSDDYSSLVTDSPVAGFLSKAALSLDGIRSLLAAPR